MILSLQINSVLSISLLTFLDCSAYDVGKFFQQKLQHYRYFLRQFFTKKARMKFKLNPLALASTLLISMVNLPVNAYASVQMPTLTKDSTLSKECKSDAWNEPTAPRHLYGNTWYVGTCGISVILIASPQGHILIDSGPANGFDAVSKSLQALGVRLKDIRTILTTHEHHDHTGGVAQFQKESGAQVLVRKDALDSMRTGKADRRDPQFKELSPFAPVANLKLISDGAIVKRGKTTLRNIPMSGHAPGGSGWTWKECEKGVCHQIVFSDSLGSISDDVYRYSDEGGMAAALRDSIARIGAAPCDILVTGHTGASGILERLDGKAALVDKTACQKLAELGLKNLELRLQKEAESSKATAK